MLRQKSAKVSQRSSGKSSGWQWIILLGVAVLTVYYFIPRMDELNDAMRATRNINPWWTVAAAAASAMSYVMAATVILGSTRRSLGFRKTLIVQIATTALNRITPKGIGGMALAEQYLESSGLKRIKAVAAVSLIYFSGFLTHLLLLGVALYAIGTQDIDVLSLRNTQIVSLGLVTLVLTAGLAAIPPINTFIVRVTKEAWQALQETVTRPVRALQLAGGSIGITLMYVAALYCTLNAVGAEAALPTVFLVYMAGSTVAAAAPTPSGLGAAEAALTVGLTATGIPTGEAVAGVLVFRLLTFWLPIIPAIIALRHVTKHYLT